MALFTDFFPAGGGGGAGEQTVETVYASAIAGFSIPTAVTVGGQTLQLTHTSPQPSLTVGDHLRITSGNIVAFGTIASLGAAPFTATIMLSGPTSQAIPVASGNVSVQEITTGGQNEVAGDLYVTDGDISSGGGDVMTGGGDITTGGGGVDLGGGMLTGDVTGDVTGNSDTATALENARNFSIDGDSGAGMGDITAAAVSFDGTANVILDATVDDGAIGTAKLADDAVTNAKVADDAVDTDQIVDDAVTNDKIAADVAGAGLSQATDGSLDVNTGATSGTVTARGLNVNNDIVGVNVGTGLHIDSSGLLAVNTLSLNNTFNVSVSGTGAPTAAATATAVGALTSGTLEAGDLVIARNAATPPIVETFLYIGTTSITLPGTVPAAMLVDITNSGGGVTSITPGSGLSGTGAMTGAVTLTVGSGNGISVTDNDVAVQIATGSANQLSVGSGGLSVTTAAVADAGTALATGDQIHSFVTGLTSGTQNTVTKFGTGGDLADSNILDDGTITTINGTNFTVGANGTTSINSETINIGDGTDGTTTIAGGSLNLNPTGAINTNNVTSLTLQTTAASNGNVALTAGGTGSLTATGGSVTLTSTGNGSVGIAAAGTGNLSLNSNTGEIRLAGNGIATTATDAATLNLVVGSNGHLMTTTRADSGFSVVTASLTGTASTTTHGDIIVLPPLGSGATAGRTFALPSSPSPGDAIQVSNLSATGSGSNRQLWGFTNHGGVIMGTSVSGTFELDDATASFTLVYISSTYGWVIIGAN